MASELNHYFARVLLATIHDQGLCPCPCCLVHKSKLDQLGSFVDMKNRVTKSCKYNIDVVNEARRAIYDLGMPINGVAVQWLLKATSTVPTMVHYLPFHLNHA
jgi:hypothetical protein